jgi:dienelactone hydrolase
VPLRLLVAIVLAVAADPAGVAAKTVKTLEDGRTGTVEFESLTHPLNSGQLLGLTVPDADAKPVVVSGKLSVPRSATRAPAVILLHGCSGITGVQTGWVYELGRLQLATFLVDSFDGRSIRELCTARQRLNSLSLLVDAYRALDLLATHPRIDPTRIALMGFSMGGRTALWSSYARFRTRWVRHDGPQFVGYLSFYPAVSWLRIQGEEDIDVRPIRIFQGAADDWTPLGPIEAYVKRLQAAGSRNISLVAYEGAHHGFDNPRGAYPPTTYAGVVNAHRCRFVEQPDGKVVEADTGRAVSLELPCFSRGSTTGYHPQAYEKAIADVKTFLSEVFASSVK